ncbi:hypothetical protein YC2023_015750 [Brassica napus]
MEVTWEEGSLKLRWLLTGKNLILTKLFVGVKIVGVMCSNALTRTLMDMSVVSDVGSSHLGETAYNKWKIAKYDSQLDFKHKGKPKLESNAKSESVNGTNAGRKSLPEDKGPDVPAAVPADASSLKDKASEPSLTTYLKVVQADDVRESRPSLRDKQGLTIILEINLDDFTYHGRLCLSWTTFK